MDQLMLGSEDVWAISKTDYFDHISVTKAISRKYLMESCSSKLFLQLSFKYYVKSCFIAKLFSKV